MRGMTLTQVVAIDQRHADAGFKLLTFNRYLLNQTITYVGSALLAKDQQNFMEATGKW